MALPWGRKVPLGKPVSTPPQFSQEALHRSNSHLDPAIHLPNKTIPFGSVHRADLNLTAKGALVHRNNQPLSKERLVALKIYMLFLATMGLSAVYTSG